MQIFLIIVKLMTSIFAMVRNLFVRIANAGISVWNKRVREKNDEINRGVTEISHCTIESLLPDTGDIDSTLISGGRSEIRAQFISRLADNAQRCGYAVIILHESNSNVPQLLSKIVNIGKLVLVGPQTPCFEPFYKLSLKEICKTVYDTATQDYDLKKNCNYYIEGMCEFLKSKKIQPTLKSFNTCPHAELFDKIDSLVMKGLIADAQAQAMKSKLMMGQSEQYKLEALIGDWFDQCESVLCQSKSGQRYSILSSLQDKRVISIDISSNVNILFINSIISQIRQAVSKGLNLVLITENLTMSGNEKVKKLLSEKTDKVKVIACTSDAISMCDGEDKTFSTLVGNSEHIIILGHASGSTCTKWAETIGYYNKEEETRSYEKGSMRHSPFALFPGSNQSTSRSYSIKREYIVRPEQINRMDQNEVYSYSHRANQLVHTYLE